MKKLWIVLIMGVLVGAGVGVGACGSQAKSVAPESIALPAVTESGTTLLQALKDRSSVRSFADVALSPEQLSGVLWAAAGQNRPDGKLTAPSAMALYPIRTYAVLADGVYLYDAASHSLKLVAAGDHRRLAGLQDFVYTAPLNIVYVADMAVFGDRWSSSTTRPEGEDGGMPEADILRLCSLDAAGYCQNANLWAAANGLGAVTRAGAQGEEFLKVIGAPASYRFVLAQTVGVPAK